MAGWTPSTLLAEVTSRLINDSGTGGLFASGNRLVTAVWTRRFPLPNTSITDYPYVIVYFDAIQGNDTFKDEAKRIGMRVEWFVDEQANSVDSVERCGKILERVVGDWTDQSSGIPTYGLHHWTPTLQAGWNSGPLLFESASDESFADGLGVIRWSAMFSVEVNKQQA